MKVSSFKINTIFCSAVILFASLICNPLFAKADIELKDPMGDDNGPGTYTYPTNTVYTKGSFDILKVTVRESGDNVEFAITVKSKLENPWTMESGFSIQMAEIYIDKDHAANSGHVDALPGIYCKFSPDEAWDKVIIVSPQPRSKVQSEIQEKAKDIAGDIVIPMKVTPRGNTIIALVRKDDLGGAVDEKWGYQVLMTSNEGYPANYEILTRRVNAKNGDHRFGGGDDGEGDPHFMDMLYPPAAGEKAEIEGQHKVLSQYKSDEDDKANNVLAVVPMVYPAAAAKK